MNLAPSEFHRKSKQTTCLLLLPFIFSCWSSSSEIKRYAIKGTVTYQGKPLSDGEIEFEPDSARGNRGPFSKAIIKNSEYSVETKRGVVGGPYLVRITGFAPIKQAPNASSQSPEPPPPKILFQNHVISTELPKEQSTQTFDVPEK